MLLRGAIAFSLVFFSDAFSATFELDAFVADAPLVLLALADLAGAAFSFLVSVYFLFSTFLPF